jgi:Reverse transcriptase (RNA-dependent DNA polymerase)
VHHFTRLPFGLKRAPSYFQEVMATIVLAGLIYIICEMYIDDCILYGPDTKDFVDRLRQVFMRFRQHHLFLKASKCHFGYTEIEYIGIEISEDGLRMSQDTFRIRLSRTDYFQATESFLGFSRFC